MSGWEQVVSVACTKYKIVYSNMNGWGYSGDRYSTTVCCTCDSHNLSGFLLGEEGGH